MNAELWVPRARAFLEVEATTRVQGRIMEEVGVRVVGLIGNRLSWINASNGGQIVAGPQEDLAGVQKPRAPQARGWEAPAHD